MTWKLQAITDEILGSEISIDRDMLVGRHQDADIVLQSADISRRHAAFVLRDVDLLVQDLKSSNGTYVNDVRIEHETILKNDDIVQFASLKFSVLAPTDNALAEVHTAEVIDIEPSAVVQTSSETPVSEPLTQTKPEPVIETIPQEIEQPSEAIATSEYVAETTELSEKDTNSALGEVQSTKEHIVQDVPTPAQEMTQQGMPSLTERATETPVSSEGMPERIAVPKPAPIPEGVEIKAEPQPTQVVTPETNSIAGIEQEEKKNASVGLVSIIVLIILAILAWLFLK